MKTDLETAWCKATSDERQSFVELFSDDIREMLPTYDDRDRPETDELIGHGQDDDGGDDETLDAPELPSVLDTNDSDDDGDFAVADDEDFREATRGIKRRAGGKRVPAAPRSPGEIERMTAEFLARGGQVTKVRRGVTGLQPPKQRTPAWRKIASKGA